MSDDWKAGYAQGQADMAVAFVKAGVLPLLNRADEVADLFADFVRTAPKIPAVERWHE